jgi:hypothetical protein
LASSAVLTLERRVEHVLALLRVHEQPEDQVNGSNERFSDEKCLPDILRAAHFGHEFIEHCGAAVREDTIHHSVDIVLEVLPRWGACRSLDGTGDALLLRCRIIWDVRVDCRDSGLSLVS